MFKSLVLPCLLSFGGLLYCATAEGEVSLATYFEIPVSDMPRAIAFYEHVLGVKLTLQTIDGVEMALFPDPKTGAITGALAKGDSYVAGKQGVRLYFKTDKIETLMDKVQQSGGTTHYPKTDIGELGFVAEFIDTEGNIIALHEPATPDLH